jgi:hypothetical protein
VVEDGLMLIGIEKVDQQSLHSMSQTRLAGAKSKGVPQQTQPRAKRP